MKITNKIANFRNQRGISSLVLVLFAVIILSSIMIAIYAMALVLTRQSTRFYTSQSAFFAAEGAMFETIERMKQYRPWPNLSPGDLPITDNYEIGETKIARTIEFIDADPDDYYLINIDADNRGSKRSVEANYVPSTTTTATSKYDIILVVDASTSMCEVRLCDECESKEVNCKSSDHIDANGDDLIDAPVAAIEYAKNASVGLARYLEANSTPGQHRMGLVVFNNAVINSYFQSLTDNFDTVVSKIKLIGASGGTNLSAPMDRASQDLVSNGRDDAEKIIIFFSDGVPQHSISYVRPTPDPYNPGSCGGSQPCTCDNNECTYDWPAQINTGVYEPAQQINLLMLQYFGSYCTDEAVKYAAIAKASFPVYSVFLKTQPKVSACGNHDKTILLGQYTLFRMSSEVDSLKFDATKALNNEYEFYKETPDPGQLNSIFQGIISTVVTGGSLKYHEVDPGNPIP